MMSLMAIICEGLKVEQLQRTKQINELSAHLAGNIKTNHTFSCSMWQRSLISLNVLLASIMLSKAFPIFLMATSSCVSEFTAALQRKKLCEPSTRFGYRNRRDITLNFKTKSGSTRTVNI